MRTALISACKRTPEGILRSDELIAGRALLDWQVDLALHLGCERIVCLCDAPSSVVIAQQRRIESAGLAFLTARGPLQLAALVRDEDMIILMLDGLFVSKGTASQLLADGDELNRVIWTLAANHPLSSAFPEDFERIDREHHWAGLAVIPGRCIGSLADLPGDGEAVSLLLRLALQARTDCMAVPSHHLEGGEWFLAPDASARERHGAAIIETSLRPPQWTGPGRALANTLVRKTAHWWLRSGVEVSGGIALGLGAIGAGLTGFGFATAGLGVVGLGAFVAALCAHAGEMRGGIAGEKPNGALSKGIPLAIAAFAILTLVLALPPGDGYFLRGSLPVIAIGLAWVAGQSGSLQAGAFWRDTPLHLALMAGFAGFGVLQEGLLVFCLGALLALVLRIVRQ